MRSGMGIIYEGSNTVPGLFWVLTRGLLVEEKRKKKTAQVLAHLTFRYNLISFIVLFLLPRTVLFPCFSMYVFLMNSSIL